MSFKNSDKTDLNNLSSYWNHLIVRAEILCSKSSAVHYYIKVIFQLLKVCQSLLYHFATCLLKSETKDIRGATAFSIEFHEIKMLYKEEIHDPRRSLITVINIQTKKGNMGWTCSLDCKTGNVTIILLGKRCGQWIFREL